jgi:hypothetical protein
MGCYRYSQMFLNVAHCLLVSCVADFRPLVIGGLFKLIASLAVACLLAFVVVHSASICKQVAAYFHALPISLLVLVVEPRRVRRSQAIVVVPNEPSLSPLFQRPPPIFSL